LHLIIFLIEDNAILAMIVKSTTIIELGVTFPTCNHLRIVMQLHNFLHLLLKVDSQAMNHAISFGKCSECAIIHGALESLQGFALLFQQFRMLGTNMKV
jgi:hypothetical protein